MIYASDYLDAFAPAFTYGEMTFDEDLHSYVLESKEDVSCGPYKIDYSNIIIHFEDKKLKYISYHSESTDSTVNDVYIDDFRDYGTTEVTIPDVE